MSRKVGLGIIGCGTIADVYMTNLTQHFENVELLAVADLYAEKAQQAAEKFGVARSCTVEELLQDPAVEIVLNLTIPAAHYSVNKQILEAGKHAYCEKPLALNFEEAEELVKLAESKGLLCVSAPDTFLGGGMQQVKDILDSGRIGKAIGFTANMVCPGHELWHPAPAFYYKNGGGPLFDMGPYYLTALVYLLGPIRQISAFVSSGRPVRNIQGVETETEVPTNYTGILEFENGAIGTMTMSFDIWKSSLPLLEIYGTEGSVYAPDPNGFTGNVTLFDGNKLKNIVNGVTDPHPARLITMVTQQDSCLSAVECEFPVDDNPRGNMRGLGVSDMAQSLIDGRPSRLSGAISLHVVEALNAFEASAKSGAPYVMKSTCASTELMGKDWALWEVK